MAAIRMDVGPVAGKEAMLSPSDLPPPIAVMNDAPELGVGMILQQKNSECCRCFVCQPNIHWNVAQYQEEIKSSADLPVAATVIEDASWCGRTWSCCMPGCRETKYSVFQGNVDLKSLSKVDGHYDYSSLGAPMLTHEKKQTLGTYVLIPTPNGMVPVPLCCNLPYMETKDNKGQVLGLTQYECDAFLCVPKYSVKNAEGVEEFRIRPDVCCLGCCVRPKCNGNGGKCLRVPYYIRGPDDQKMDDAKISDLWSGLKKECCHKKNNWQIKYPEQATNAQKATLFGAAILVDITIEEQQQ